VKPPYLITPYIKEQNMSNKRMTALVVYILSTISLYNPLPRVLGRHRVKIIIFEVMVCIIPSMLYASPLPLLGTGP